MIEYGKEYKLKTLCDELGIELKNGGYQTKRMIERLQHEYVIEKNGSKYVVLRELTELEKIEQMKYNKAKMFVEPIIYQFLLNEPDNVIVKSIPELAKEMFLVNSNYYDSKNDKRLERKIPFDLNNGEVSTFYNFLYETSPMITRFIDSILDDMQNKSLILWHKELTFAKEVFVYKDPKTGKSIYKTETWKHEDESDFLDVQKEVWNKYGITCRKDLYKPREGITIHELQRYINDDIASHYNISYCFYKRHITIGKKALRYELSQLEYKQMTNSFSYEKFLSSQQGILKEIEADLKKRIVDYSIKI